MIDLATEVKDGEFRLAPILEDVYTKEELARLLEGALIHVNVARMTVNRYIEHALVKPHMAGVLLHLHDVDQSLQERV